MTHLREVLVTQKDLLIFRVVKPDLKNHFPAYIGYALVVTWLVGLGRYWDHPNAALWQYAGLGSIAYIFILAGLLYLLVLPLPPRNWSYRGVLVFVGFTSLPALLYAIPVERFLPLQQAQTANAAFLLLVACWRVALYVRFLVTTAGLDWFRVIVATLLPLSTIIAVLALLNLEHVVFSLMSGIREEDRSANDMAYEVVVTLSVFAFLAFPVTLLGYLFVLFGKRPPNTGVDHAGRHCPSLEILVSN